MAISEVCKRLVTGTTRSPKDEAKEATELLLTFKQRPHIIEVETITSKKYVILPHANPSDDSYDYGKQS